MSKLILVNAIKGLGSIGDVVVVKDGYARNYLIPRGFAILWTKNAEQRFSDARDTQHAREVENHEKALALKEALEGQTITLFVKLSKTGRMFGSVRINDIADAISSVGVAGVDKNNINIATPIKSTGSHEVSVRINNDLSATLKLKVAGEEEKIK